MAVYTALDGTSVQGNDLLGLNRSEVVSKLGEDNAKLFGQNNPTNTANYWDKSSKNYSLGGTNFNSNLNPNLDYSGIEGYSGDYSALKTQGDIDELSMTDYQTNTPKKEPTGLGFDAKTLGTATAALDAGVGLANYLDRRQLRKTQKAGIKENIAGARAERTAIENYRKRYNQGTA